MNPRLRQRLLFILGAVGLIISVYLTVKAKAPSTVMCSIGHACEIVLSSQYAWLFGLPISAYGLVWYLGLLVIVYLLPSRSIAETWLKVWILGGLAFSLWLLGIEAFVLHAYCTWCVGSLVVVLLLTGLTFVTSRRADEFR